jgi:outer membrane protein assembly factor BamA
VGGGAHGQVLLGALWDTRDHETDPSSGSLEEIAFRFSAAPTGSRYDYVGVTVGLRQFWSLGTPRLIFAQRVLADVLSPDAPFFEWSQFGGFAGGEGIGGMSSVRGVPRNRYQGTAKVISNSELRFYVWEFPLLGETLKTGGVAFIDLGRVWHPGVDDGSLWRWHPGVGAGLRLARRAAVARFDVAISPELWRTGVYVTFGHMF